MVLPQTQHLRSCRANTCCLNFDGIFSFGGETLTFQEKSGPLYSSPNSLYRLNERDMLGYDITHLGYSGIPVLLPISCSSFRSSSSHLSRVKERSFSAATSHSGDRDLAGSQTVGGLFCFKPDKRGTSPDRQILSSELGRFHP